VQTTRDLLQSAHSRTRSSPRATGRAWGAYSTFLSAESALAGARAQETQARTTGSCRWRSWRHDTAHCGDRTNRPRGANHETPSARDTGPPPVRRPSRRLLQGAGRVDRTTPCRSRSARCPEGRSILISETIGRALFDRRHQGPDRGELIEVAFHEGQDVRRGDLLFRIDPRPYDARSSRGAHSRRTWSSCRRAAGRGALRRPGEEGLRHAGGVRSHPHQRRRARGGRRGRPCGWRARRCSWSTAPSARRSTAHREADGESGQPRQGERRHAFVVINQIDPIYVAFSVPQRTCRKSRRAGRTGRLEGAGDRPRQRHQPPRAPGAP